MTDEVFIGHEEEPLIDTYSLVLRICGTLGVFIYVRLKRTDLDSCVTIGELQPLNHPDHL